MYITTEHGDLSARVVDGPPPVAVLWHSMFTDSRSWDRVMHTLATERTLVLVDGWSFGDSADLKDELPDFVTHCAHAAVAVVTHVQQALGVGPVDWLGSAWGGHVGLQLAADRPDLMRTLVTVSAPVTPASPALRRQVRVLLPVYRAIGMRGPVRRGVLAGMLTEHSLQTDPQAVNAVVGPMSRPHRGAIARTVHSGILSRRDLASAATLVECPTLLFATDDRGEWTPQECAAATATMQDGHAAVLTRSRALPSLECPAELAHMVTEFWRTHPPVND